MPHRTARTNSLLLWPKLPDKDRRNIAFALHRKARLTNDKLFLNRYPDYADAAKSFELGLYSPEVFIAALREIARLYPTDDAVRKTLCETLRNAKSWRRQ